MLITAQVELIHSHAMFSTWIVMIKFDIYPWNHIGYCPNEIFEYP